MKLFPREDFTTMKPVQIKVPHAEKMMSLNESPYNPIELFESDLLDVLRKLEINRYFQGVTHELQTELLAYVGADFSEQHLFLGNGADEILYYLFTAFNGTRNTVVYPYPSYFDYKTYSRAAGMQQCAVDLQPDFQLNADEILAAAHKQQASLIVLCNPNNPTGNLFSEASLRKIVAEAPCAVLVDEAYYEFAGTTLIDWVHEYKHLAVLRSFSKGFFAAGLRFGYLVADPSFLHEMNKVRMAFNSSLFVQALALVLLRNKDQIKQMRNELIAEREHLLEEMQTIQGIRVHPSRTNFLLFQIPGQSLRVHEELEKQGISVRNVTNRFLEDALRVTIDLPENNRFFVEKLREIMS